MIAPQDRLYSFFRFCAEQYDKALWRLFPAQHGAAYEAKLNRTIAALFPNGACQSCECSKRGVQI